MAAGRPRLRHLLGATVVVATLFAGLDLLLLARLADPGGSARVHLVVGAAGVLTILVFAGALAGLQRFVFRPLEQLNREVRVIGVNPEHTIELPRRHLLGEVPDAIGALGRGLASSKRVIAKAVAVNSSELEGSKSRLETILMSLREGVLVCDDRERIVFYNPAARAVFHDNPALGVGRSLHLLVPAAPVENSLQVLRQRRVRHQEAREAESDVSFVCTTLQGGILSCGIRLLPDLPGLSWSFVLTCEDISRDADARGRREDLLRATVKSMRPPLTGLSVSAESLEMLHDLDAARRGELERSIARDARRLVAQFEVLAREVEEMESPRYLIRDVFAEDLLASVAQRLEARAIRLTMVGDPLWVRADVHALLFLLEFLALGICRSCGVAAIEVETLLGDKRVYFTFCWQGGIVPEAEIQRWVGAVAEPFGGHTVAEVLERLGSEVWSRRHETPGFATLSFPVPAAAGRWGPPPSALPSRPVYEERPAAGEFAADEDIKRLPLEKVHFVVFDTETTGLAPAEGDEIVSIAGVKIINRGIVVGETFDQIVDPGRSIPKTSTVFHGITDEMVRGKPSVETALRSFHAFVGDAVLVGHNAAFDLRFIRLKQRGAGVHFRGPVLDTLALSHFLHDHTPVHSLDAIARRLGVEVRDRHTALGDSLITAEILLKFLYLLQERGVTTLGRALEISGQ